MDKQVLSETKDAENLEKEIREKIDAIFEQEISDNRFVRSSSEQLPTKADTRNFAEQLSYFRQCLSDQRQELKTFIEHIRLAENIRRFNQERTEKEQLEMVETILHVGREVGPFLDRLLTLTRRMLDDLSAK